MIITSPYAPDGYERLIDLTIEYCGDLGVGIGVNGYNK